MWLTILEVILFVAVLITGLGCTLIGLPGNWLMVLAAIIYRLVGPTAESRLFISWYAIGAVVALALLGEAGEILAGALGVAKVGGSRRAVALALAGSVLGGIAGLVITLPIPFGFLIGPIIFAGLGAFAGAVLGERSHGKDLDESLPVGHAAFWGRLLGTTSKLFIGVAIAVVLIGALCY